MLCEQRQCKTWLVNLLWLTSGQTDSIIPSKGSEHYYKTIMALDPNVQDYYRLFLAPGVNHCLGGPGAYPDMTFDALRKWVETSEAPETLAATSVYTTPVIKRLLCPYPKKQYYNGTREANSGEGFYCE